MTYACGKDENGLINFCAKNSEKCEILSADELDLAAIQARFDVCSFSLAMFPFVADEYALLRVGAKFSDLKLFEARKFKKFNQIQKIVYDDFSLCKIIAKSKPGKHYKSDEALNAVAKGGKDLAIFASERNKSELESIANGAQIIELFGLNLPQSGLFIRRSIPLLKAIKFEQNLSEFYTSEISQNKLDTLNALYKFGLNLAIYPQIYDAASLLIPREYENIRFERI